MREKVAKVVKNERTCCFFVDAGCNSKDFSSIFTQMNIHTAVPSLSGS